MKAIFEMFRHSIMCLSPLGRRLAMVAVLAALPLLSCGIGGCNTGPSQSQTDAERQNQALNDPMNYKLSPPAESNSNAASFDRQGFNRDMNDVINP